MNNATRVTIKTGRVRLAYVNLLAPRDKKDDAGKATGQQEYSACLLIPKDDKATLDAFRKGIVETAKAKWGDKAVEAFRAGKLRSPLRDGDTDREDDPDFKGCYFVNGKAQRKPLLIDEQRQDITRPEDFNSGDYAKVMVNLYAYDKAGNKGVGVGINGVQRWGRGKSMAGAGASRSDFDNIEVKADEVELADTDDLPF